MNELALFAGAGGGLLGGLLCGFRTVCAVEIDPFCREVLLRRQLDGCLPNFPIWDDARTFDGKPWRWLIDVITGGFPCQPFSVAGKRKADNDERNMWPETARIVAEVRPRFCLFENVPGIRRYLPVVIRDLRRLGYTVKRPTIVSAAAVGAGHIRRRVWIFAHRDGTRGEQPQGGIAEQRERAGNSAEIPAYHDGAGVRLEPGRGTGEAREGSALAREISGDSKIVGCQDNGETNSVGVPPRGHTTDWWADEPRMARVVHGLANRVHRARALGNGQVPAVARLAWEILSGRN